MTQDSWESQRAAAVILRAGSRNYVQTWMNFWTGMWHGQRYGCEIEGYLIGYLFRFAAADAAKRFTEETGSGNDPCGTYSLRTLDTVRYSDERFLGREGT